MTWKEFKEFVESRGVTDDDVVRYMDFGSEPWYVQIDVPAEADLPREFIVS